MLLTIDVGNTQTVVALYQHPRSRAAARSISARPPARDPVNPTAFTRASFTSAAPSPASTARVSPSRSASSMMRSTCGMLGEPATSGAHLRGIASRWLQFLLNQHIQ